MTDPQTITLTTTKPALVVRALRGETPPIPTGGFSGWQTTARPRRKALTEWVGIDPFQLQLSLIFDGVPTNASVETACRALERMAQPAGELLEPPIVRVAGVVPHPELAYVIADGNGGSGLSWDANPIYSRSGYRIRQQVTVTLLEYVAADRVAATPAAARARQQTAAASAKAAKAAGGKTGARTYTVKAGDTLTAIAARELGAAKRWTEIARLNDLTDPYTIRTGQVLRLP